MSISQSASTTTASPRPVAVEPPSVRVVPPAAAPSIPNLLALVPGQRAITSFFGAAGHPLNLAVVRIAVFLGLLLLFDWNEVLWFSQLPHSLQFGPGFLDKVLPYVPINPTWASTASIVFVASCVAALFGLFTRASAWIAVISGLYVLGIPQFYGKINHYHHLLWFAAVLASSPCADAFSIDAIRSAWRRADKGDIELPGAARAYRLPICIILVLMGLVYFFPGFWKAAIVGPDWAFSDNLKYMMYEKWTELDGWLPFFRIDQYPLLYRAAAVGTIVFEVSFVFLIFTRLRPLLFVGGLAFHNLTNAFMAISFWSLQLCYVALVDWQGLLARLGRRLFPEPMYVLYDGNCKLCRRTVASLRVFDVFGRINYVKANSPDARRAEGLGWLDHDAVTLNMYAVVGHRTFAGYAAYRALAGRIPWLWPLLPAFYLPPVAVIGQLVYRRVADSRLCSVVPATTNATQNASTSSVASLRPIVLVGSAIVVAVVFFGVRKNTGWPFASYPTFAVRAVEIKELMTLGVTYLDGRTIELPLAAKARFFPTGSERVAGMTLAVALQPEGPRREQAVRDFWNAWSDRDPGLQGAQTVRFYRDRLSVLPERRGEPPLERELLLELKSEAMLRTPVATLR